MTSEALSLESLEDQVRSLAVADSPAEVFKTLLEGTRVSAPRASVFLVRQHGLKGWGAIGYPADAARRQREFIAPTAEGWLAEVLRSEPPLHSIDASTRVPRFGQPAPSECVGIAVRLRGRPIALIVTERLEGELPWYPPILGILVRVAELKLDLDMVRRKLMAGAARPAAQAGRPEPVRSRPTAAEVAPGPPSAVPDTSPLSPAADAGSPVLVDVAETVSDSVAEVAAAAPDAAAPAEDPDTEAARRYARLVATDIRLYNEESVVLGRRDGDLAERLQESLTRGKETFQRRHGDLGQVGLRILYEAYTEVLAGGKGDLIPRSILD